jgi:tetratricopeptide (TPR) repeat protein
MSASVRWIESPSWELDFYGLPHRLPWPDDADPELATRQPLDLETLLEAIDRLGTEAGEPWISFRAATGLFQELSESLEEGELVRSQRLLEEVDRLHPGSPFVLFQQGNLARLSGFDAQAIELYRAVLAKAPNIGPAWASLGSVYAQQGERTQAIEAFRKALEINGNDPIALDGLTNLRELVRLMRQTDDGKPNPEAVAYVDLPTFRQMISSQIESLSAEPDHLIALADQLLKDGLVVDVAISALEKAREVRPDHARTHLALSAAYRAVGQKEQSRASVEKLVELEPGEAVAYMHLAQACNNDGDTEGEKAALTKVLELDPNFHAAIGIFFGLSNGEHDPAKEAELAAWSQSHGSWMGHLIASSIARARGDTAAALRHADNAFALQPEAEEVLLHLSAVLGEAKELNRLATQIRPAVESRRFSARLDWNYAQTLHSLGLRDEAAGVLRRGLTSEGAPDEFKVMASNTLEAWGGVLTGSGVPLEIHPAGHLTRPILITLPDGDGGIVLGAGRRLPAEGTFPWRAKGTATVEVSLQQGESDGPTAPRPLGTFRAAEVDSSDDAKPVECHLSITPEGALHFRAAQNGRRLPVAWKQPE